MKKLTDVALVELAKVVRERYLPPEQWSCVVCGSPMTFGSSSRDGTKYWCSKMAAEVTKPYSSERMEHSRKSDRWVHDRSERPDASVVLLCEQVLSRYQDRTLANRAEGDKSG